MRLSGLAAHREHILRDLRPYVCTYPECREEDQLYDRWKDWANHEQWAHSRTWRCPDHPRAYFETADDFRSHWRTSHHDQETPSDEAARFSETVSTANSRLCPICKCMSENAESMQQHIATHLQRIALFTLPNYSDGDEDDDSQQQMAGSVSQVQADDRDSISENESVTWSEPQNVEDSGRSPSNVLSKEALENLTVDGAQLGQPRTGTLVLTRATIVSPTQPRAPHLAPSSISPISLAFLKNS